MKKNVITFSGTQKFPIFLRGFAYSFKNPKELHQLITNAPKSLKRNNLLKKIFGTNGESMADILFEANKNKKIIDEPINRFLFITFLVIFYCYFNLPNKYRRTYIKYKLEKYQIKKTSLKSKNYYKPIYVL